MHVCYHYVVNKDEYYKGKWIYIASLQIVPATVVDTDRTTFTHFWTFFQISCARVFFFSFISLFFLFHAVGPD